MYKRPITEYFKGRTYPDLRALALHTKEISDAINKQPKQSYPPYKPPKELSAFDLKVCELASRFRWYGKKFRVKEIAKRLPSRKPSSLVEIKRLSKQVSRSIQALKAHGKLTVNAKEPIHQTPLSPFHQQVLELAPRFIARDGKYKVTEIAREISGQTSDQPDWTILDKTRLRVQTTLSLLRERGLIKKQVKQVAVKLRDAKAEDITKNKGLIYGVLRSGHRYLPRDWRVHVSWDEAVEIGRIALVRAIETYDPAKGTLSTHAYNLIAAKIRGEVKKQRRHGRQVSFDQPQYHEGDRTLHDTLGTPAKEENLPEEALEHMFELYKRRKIKPSYAAIYALRHVFGHTHQEIGDYFKVKRQRIEQIEAQANLRLRLAMR